MYDWCHKAKQTESCEEIATGKLPKSWDAQACWLRVTAAEMKKAFNAKGEERSNVLHYKDLGFRFDGAKNER